MRNIKEVLQHYFPVLPARRPLLNSSQKLFIVLSLQSYLLVQSAIT